MNPDHKFGMNVTWPTAAVGTSPPLTVTLDQLTIVVPRYALTTTELGIAGYIEAKLPDGRELRLAGRWDNPANLPVDLPDADIGGAARHQLAHCDELLYIDDRYTAVEDDGKGSWECQGCHAANSCLNGAGGESHYITLLTGAGYEGFRLEDLAAAVMLAHAETVLQPQEDAEARVKAVAHFLHDRSSVTASEVIEGLGLRFSYEVKVQICGMLRQIGFKRFRRVVDGVTTWLWEKQQSDTKAEEALKADAVVEPTQQAAYAALGLRYGSPAHLSIADVTGTVGCGGCGFRFGAEHVRDEETVEQACPVCELARAPLKQHPFVELIEQARSAQRAYAEEDNKRGGYVVGLDNESSITRWRKLAEQLAAAVIGATSAPPAVAKSAAICRDPEAFDKSNNDSDDKESAS